MPANDDIKVSIVVAMRDESEVVGELLSRTHAAMEAAGYGDSSWEFIAVDDASRDSTWQRLREESAGKPWLRGIRLSRHFGQHPATFAGLEAARGEIICTMDADMQAPPEDISGLLDKVASGSGIVFGRRRHGEEGILRERIGRAVNAFLARHAAGNPPEGISTFLAARADVVREALRFRKSRPVTPYHLMLAGPQHASSIEVGESPRSLGSSKYSLLKLIGLTIDIFYGYTQLAGRALFYTALAVPAGSIGIWLMAMLAALANLQAVSAILALAGLFYAVTSLSALVFLAGEAALRARLDDGPLYVVGESF